MKYIVEIGSDRRSVSVGEDQVEIDGVKLEASLTRIEGTPVALLRIGRSVHRVLLKRVTVSAGGSTAGRGSARRGGYTINVSGEHFEVTALDERTRHIMDLTASQAGSSGPEPVVAPMPGLIVRVSVSVGDRVGAGQGVVVMEAMKMENELRASGDGVVTAVLATAGAAVEKGAVLVELSELSD